VVGVIARICPEARVIELGHGVPPQDVRTGARRLARALPYTPAGVHLAVVDPGVGGPRRALALRAGDRLLVGPDNGLLIPAAERFGGVDEAYEIGDSPWCLRPISPTFHGRDVFGPVAARLAAGEPLAAAGTPIDPATLVRLPELRPRRDGERRIVHVVEIDGFGNVITDGELPPFARVQIGDLTVTVGRTFGDVPAGELLLYTDSSGALALAVNGGSAAERLGLRTGDVLSLEPA
jgi:S-adenosylmethionine hydrolase